MSRGAVATTRSQDRRWIFAVAGVGLLMIRPLFAFGPAGWWLLVATYLAVGMASLLGLQTGQARSGTIPNDAWKVVLAVAVAVAAFGAMARQDAIPARLGVAGLVLTVLASVAEEAFFRGFLYQRLIRRGPWLAIAVGAAAFALVHALAYPPAAVWVDFAAGLLFGWQRWATGSWLVPAGTHLLANLLVVMS
jgi:membrane protease YdiL (CAAX protease family)